MDALTDPHTTQNAGPLQRRALVAALARYAIRARVVIAAVSNEEQDVLTKRFAPGLVAYAVLVGLGLFLPVLAVVGYLLLAIFFLVPVRDRHRRGS